MKKQTRDLILDVTFSLIYQHGYNATGISAILKECNIPKGSLYHHFKSKKELVLAMIKERLSPKMDIFFSFENDNNKNSIDIIIETINKISNNENLVKYNCPLNRLNIELSNSDKDFDKELNQIFINIQNRIILLLDKSIKSNEIKQIDTNSLSEFIITSTWGALSLSSNQSSQDKFINNTNHIKQYLLSLNTN
ncbi:MAG TPA: TetR/AcrR family transcriptional regulator [Bacteroidia bacterium]|nr:TetR/AcrR family transcriptional regulator [Arcobacter sp.]HIP33862.1 TetR/AcrR family transcriptional regulator [Bacteroidia bacterium]